MYTRSKFYGRGYNAGMQASDAKYKVYLHQDTLILNRNFISDLLQVFNSDKAIGMLGVLGMEKVPWMLIAV